MKKIITPVFLLLTLIACQPKEQSALQPNTTTQQDGLMSVAQIDAIIKADILATKELYSWTKASDEMLWSATLNSHNLLSIGYKPTNVGDMDDVIKKMDMNAKEWKDAKKAVLQLIFEEERKVNPNLDINTLEVLPNEDMPMLDITVSQLSTIKRLRSSGMIYFAEPFSYETKLFNTSAANTRVAAGSGCGTNGPNTGLKAGEDYTTITPGCKMSWNYATHGIPTAWKKGTGRGIIVMNIDTGIDPKQENLGSAFNKNFPQRGPVTKIVTQPKTNWLGLPIEGQYESADDICGHGTSTAGVLAAPRSSDGNAVGVAYEASLVSCRAYESPLIWSAAGAYGMGAAFVAAATKIPNLKIISFTMGGSETALAFFSPDKIKTAIKAAASKGIMIFCAAGTSDEFGVGAGLLGVVFPANMPEVYAVTGVKDNLTQPCATCHTGSEVDFAVVMEKKTNGHHPISMANYGDVPSTTSGSSVATPTMAGMAALVWSAHPTEKASQILARLIKASSNVSKKSTTLGWGIVDVSKAM